jgi:hypothetical protein
MELKDLLVEARGALDDAVPPYLYEDLELIGWLNAAVPEAAIRTRQLQDDTSAACRITLVPGIARYRLDPAIFVVRAVFVPTRKEGLQLVTAQRLDKLCPGWAHLPDPGGSPKYAVFDVGQNVLRLYPAPNEDGTMHLRVWRQPFDSERMEGDSDEPALTLPNAAELKHWAAYEAFSKKDSELNDPARAAEHYQLFEAAFGRRPTVSDLVLWSQSRIVGTRSDVDY